MYSLRITMLLSFIVAGCLDMIPDSELMANDSAPRTRFAFTLGRLACTAFWLSITIVLHAKSRQERGKNNK
jgi:hypothetical protein